MKILVTGGAGYVGSALVPELCLQGHHVTVYDTFWFGHNITTVHDNRTFVKGDIRDIPKLSAALEGIEAVIHLACISNDASFQLNPKLSTSINLDAFKPVLGACERAGIHKFINASTCSVYGISDTECAESSSKVPITLYNQYKWECEQILAAFDPDFAWITIRPATICGYSPRMRLDLSVNLLTAQAISKGEMTVFGGSQMRPNLHIDDMIDAYLFLLHNDVDRKTYNYGAQNLTIMEIASTIQKLIPSNIIVTASDDNRSYRINSDLIWTELGLTPKRTITDFCQFLNKIIDFFALLCYYHV